MVWHFKKIFHFFVIICIWSSSTVYSAQNSDSLSFTFIRDELALRDSSELTKATIEAAEEMAHNGLYKEAIEILIQDIEDIENLEDESLYDDSIKDTIAPTKLENLQLKNQLSTDTLKWKNEWFVSASGMLSHSTIYFPPLDTVNISAKTSGSDTSFSEYKDTVWSTDCTIRLRSIKKGSILRKIEPTCGFYYDYSSIGVVPERVELGSDFQLQFAQDHFSLDGRLNNQWKFNKSYKDSFNLLYYRVVGNLKTDPLFDSQTRFSFLTNLTRNHYVYNRYPYNSSFSYFLEPAIHYSFVNKPLALLLLFKYSRLQYDISFLDDTLFTSYNSRTLEPSLWVTLNGNAFSVALDGSFLYEYRKDLYDKKAIDKMEPKQIFTTNMNADIEYIYQEKIRPKINAIYEHCVENYPLYQYPNPYTNPVDTIKYQYSRNKWTITPAMDFTLTTLFNGKIYWGFEFSRTSTFVWNNNKKSISASAQKVTFMDSLCSDVDYNLFRSGFSLNYDWKTMFLQSDLNLSWHKSINPRLTRDANYFELSPALLAVVQVVSWLSWTATLDMQFHWEAASTSSFESYYSLMSSLDARL